LNSIDELLERIETHYVEPVGLEPLAAAGGLDNLEVALRDPVFLKANIPGAAPERCRRLRDAYKAQRERVGARDRRRPGAG
jgi:carboxyl-terminal processing protease